MKAIHKDTGETVNYTLRKDFLGNNMVAVIFIKNKEYTTMSLERFNKLFRRVK